MTHENSPPVCPVPEPPTEAKVSEYFRGILDEAHGLSASAIEIEPERRRVVFRLRGPAGWSEFSRLPKRWQTPVVVWLKLITGMDAAVRDTPQAGKALCSCGRDECRLFVSTDPTAFGERILIRIDTP